MYNVTEYVMYAHHTMSEVTPFQSVNYVQCTQQKQ